MTRKRRELTELEIMYLERFRKIWNEKKQQLQLTQEKAGHACGWNGQSAFSQYLGGLVPLNIEAVLRLAKVLQVHPAEIMPDINELLPEGREDATAATEQEREDLALARLILELPDTQRVALQNEASAFSSEVTEQADALNKR